MLASLPQVIRRKKILAKDLIKEKGVCIYQYADIGYHTDLKMQPFIQLQKPHILPRGLSSGHIMAMRLASTITCEKESKLVCFYAEHFISNGRVPENQKFIYCQSLI
jgi:hypothetical protein